MEEVKQGKTDLMADLHALNCGLKSVVSFQTAQGIEQCRLACGGHGYSKGSGIPQLFGVAVGGCTYEGENLVMLLQLARYLMKLVPQIKSGSSKGRPSELIRYLFEANRAPNSSTLNAGQTQAEQWLSIQLGFEHIARQIVLRAFNHLEKTKKSGLTYEEAWVEVSAYVIEKKKIK
jgi:acyl-CoA oxidase